MLVLSFYCLAVICILSRSVCYARVAQGDASGTISYLHNELTSCANAQQSVASFLHKNRIHIGLPPKNAQKKSYNSGVPSRIAISTENNDIQCRVALSKAPVGTKCVAPCGCTGSQKWVQYSELNRLRRIDPSQWTTCRTCQEKFNYALFDAYGGPSAALLGFFVERLWLLRSTILLVSVPLLYMVSAHLWLSRIIVSRSLWQKFPQWSRLVHLPLALKFWLLKIVLQWVGGKWNQWEREVLLVKLADWETSLIEEHLPVPSDTLESEASSNNPGDDDELI